MYSRRVWTSKEVIFDLYRLYNSPEAAGQISIFTMKCSKVASLKWQRTPTWAYKHKDFTEQKKP